LTIIRDTAIYTIKTKSETLAKFREYVAIMENSTGSTVKSPDG